MNSANKGNTTFKQKRQQFINPEMVKMELGTLRHGIIIALDSHCFFLFLEITVAILEQLLLGWVKKLEKVLKQNKVLCWRREKVECLKMSGSQGEPGPHVLPSSAAHDALIFLLLFLGTNRSLPYRSQICLLYMDQVCPPANPPLNPQCGQLWIIVTFDKPFFSCDICLSNVFRFNCK